MATFSFTDPNRLIGIERPPIEVINRGENSFKSDLLSIYEGIQTDRTAMLAEVRELQLAAQLLLDAEAQRIAVYAPNDDRIALLVASGQTILDRVDVLDQEVDVSTVRLPMVTKTEALLHGRITDDADRAAGPVTVTLTDENGTAVAGVPPAEVDSGGFYAIVVPADVASTFPSSQKLTLTISNGAQKVATGIAPVTLGAGTVLSQDVQLDASKVDILRLRLPISVSGASVSKSSKQRSSAAKSKTNAPRGPKTRGKSR